MSPRDEFAVLLETAMNSDNLTITQPQADEPTGPRLPAPNRAQGTSDGHTPPYDPRTAFDREGRLLASKFAGCLNNGAYPHYLDSNAAAAMGAWTPYKMPKYASMPGYEAGMPLVARRYCALWGRGT